MTQDTAIYLEKLGKKYRLGEYTKGSKSLREAIMEVCKQPFRKNRKEAAQTIWALEDVSLNVNKGEVLGVIGPNGAGKSTLLKVLSRITEPTKGRVVLDGRVGSLLEIGTGFHPELTGRENVYLNGAILGMKHKEIDKKFDEIVDFSGIEMFMDTPVKRYSSGMQARLAFSVAAHLETEILLVDEVLAVGDLRFQKRCLEKVGEIGNSGRTVLFVSHNMAAISRLCPRTILLNHGKIVMDGQTEQVINKYVSSELQVYPERVWSIQDAPGNDKVRLLRTSVKDATGKVSHHIQSHEYCDIEMEYQVLRSDYPIKPSIRVINQDGVLIFISADTETTWRTQKRPKGTYVSRVRLPAKVFSEGLLSIGLTLSTFTPGLKHVDMDGVVVFQIVDSLDKESASSDVSGGLNGVICPYLEWKTETR